MGEPCPTTITEAALRSSAHQPIQALLHELLKPKVPTYLCALVFCAGGSAVRPSRDGEDSPCQGARVQHQRYLPQGDWTAWGGLVLM